jgi:hypothetical protein
MIEKSHDRLSASWRSWKASSIAWSKSEDLRSKEAKGVTVSLRTYAISQLATKFKEFMAYVSDICIHCGMIKSS